MIAFASMLVNPAQEAGIAVPPNPERYWHKKWPHWHVFLTIQLGAAMAFPSAHWHNAKVIAGISDTEIRKVTLNQLIAAGISIKT